MKTRLSCLVIALSFIASTVSGADAPAVIKVTPVLLAAQPSSSWTAGADKVIADALEDLPLTNTAVVAPTDYATCDYRIGWQNLVYSTSTNMWDGRLNPVAPFNGEYGRVVWALVDAQSVSGNDDLSLDMIEVITASNDGNALGKTIEFVGDNYTPRALAVKKDGTKLVNGPTSGKGKRVLALVKSPLFNIGGTQVGLDEVRDWVASYGVYALTYTAQVVGNDATRSKAKVSTSDVMSLFSLRLQSDQLSIVGGESDRDYAVYSSATVNGNWRFVGILHGNTVITVPVTGEATFFKAVAQ